MKRFKSIISLLLAMLILMSSFTMMSASAAMQPESGTRSSTPDEVTVTQLKKNAQSVKAAKALTGAGKGYNVNDSSSWGLWWKKDLKYKNAVTGKSETLYANQYINYHTINKVGSSSKTTVWCIQPYMCIYNDGNYFLTTDGGNKSFINALNKKPSIKKAVAGTIAFGKAKGATKNKEYYFAVQLLSWEFLMGLRNPTTYKLIGSKSTSTLNYVKCDTAGKFNDLTEAYNYLIEQLQTYKDMPASEMLFATINGAKVSKKSHKVRLSANSKGEYVGSINIKSLNKFDDLTYTVVNQNDHKTEKDIKVSVKGTKLTITSKANIDKDHTSNTYYVKVSRKLNVTNTTSDSVLQNKSANSQTVTSGMSFTATPSVRYIHILQEPVPKSASLSVQKNITSDSDYTGSYSGWYFLYKNTTSGDSKILVTDSEGITETVENIAINSKVTVTELGRLILSTDNVEDFKDIQTVSGKQYGLPKGFTNKTRTYSKTISSADNIIVDWENEYTKPFPVKIIKRVDDDTSVNGYYFLVYDVRSRGVIAQPTIVGPTNSEGELSFNLDKVGITTIGVVELGRLKSGHTYKAKLTVAEVSNGSFRNDFEIPSRYNPQVGSSAVTGLSDSIPSSIEHKHLIKGEKEIIIENTTSGFLKIHKQDSVTKKPLANVTYGIFYYMQSNTDDTDYSSVTTEEGTITPSSDTSVSELEGDSDSEGETDVDTPPNLVATLTTDSNGDAISKLIPTGKYYVQEMSCDEYHALDTTKYDVTITPGSNTELTAITKTFEDKPSRVVVTKRELSALNTNNNTIAGCDIDIFEKPATGKIDYSETPVYSFTTTLKSESIVGLLKVNHTYVVHEKSCPVGYRLADDIEFTVNSDGSANILTMYDETTYIKAVKIDESTNKNMAGVRLQIQDSANKPVKVKDYNGNLVESWVTTTEPLVIEGILEKGKSYKLVELETKPGYTIAPPVSFTVSDKKGEKQSITINNDTTKFDFSKRAITGTEEQPGNLMAVKEKGASTNLREWTSTTKPYRLEGVLEVNKTYVLIERKPIDGFTTAESVEFTVNNDGLLHTVVMKNAPTKIQINKVNTKNNFLAGSTLQIQDSSGKPVKVRDYNGNLVESWVSRTTPLTIEGVLAINKTYKLVELKSSAGYIVAPPVSFTVKDSSDVQIVKMVDDTTKVKFSKLAGDTNKQLSGCVLSLTDSKNKEVKRFTTTNKAYYLEGVLVAGETYTLTEISAREGYMKAKPITFKVRTDGKKQTITMVDLKYTRPDLPKTGGLGFIPFMAFGVASLFCASVVYLIKRRLKSK